MCYACHWPGRQGRPSTIKHLNKPHFLFIVCKQHQQPANQQPALAGKASYVVYAYSRILCVVPKVFTKVCHGEMADLARL